MDIMSQIDRAHKNLVSAAASFNERAAKLDAGGTPVADMTLQQAVGALKEVVGRRLTALQSEIEGLLDLSAASRESTSLLLRFRPAILGEDAILTANLINENMQQAATGDAQALNHLESLETYAVNSDASVNAGALRESIAISSRETARLHGGIMASLETPMSPEAVASFHEVYGVPVDPRVRFSQLVDERVTLHLHLCKAATDRISLSAEHAATLIEKVVPAFPGHAVALNNDAQALLAEGAQAIAAAADHLGKALDKHTLGKTLSARPSA